MAMGTAMEPQDLVDTTITSQNEEALLAEMSLLLGDTDDWREHLPYEAAVNYHDELELKNAYQTHVDSCNYCQRLIDALHPSDQVLNDFQTIRINHERDYQLGHSVFADLKNYFFIPRAVAATILVVGLTGLLFYPTTKNQLNTAQSAAMFSSQALKMQVNSPKLLADLENSDELLARLQEARIFLAAQQSEVAYQRIGIALKDTQLEAKLVEAIATAPVLPQNSSQTLGNAVVELKLLANESLLNEYQQVRFITVNAQLGQHDQALTGVRNLLINKNVDTLVLESFNEGIYGHKQVVPSEEQ